MYNIKLFFNAKKKCVHKLRNHCDFFLSLSLFLSPLLVPVFQPFRNWILCLYFKLHLVLLFNSHLMPSEWFLWEPAGCTTLAGRFPMEKEQQGTDEQCQKHFCINIANDHHFNKNTRGTRDKKSDTEQCLETKLSSTYQLMFTFVVLQFPPINEMKNLLVLKQPESTPIIYVLNWFIFAKWKCYCLQNESCLGRWGPDTYPCQALNFQKRKGKGSPAQLKGFDLTHHPPLWGSNSPWASLQVAAWCLAILRENSTGANTIMEACLKTM